MKIDPNQVNKILNEIVKLFNNFMKKPDKTIVAKPVESPVPEATTKSEVKMENNLKPITKEDLLMGRDKEAPEEYTDSVSQNLDRLVVAINKIQEVYGKQFTINSGWRTSSVNKSIPNAAPKSKHMEGLAVDISDREGEVMKWTLENLQLMKDVGVYMEDWRWTPTWTHYQIISPKSGNRIFIPSNTPAIAPNRWSGKYLAKYN